MYIDSQIRHNLDCYICHMCILSIIITNMYKYTYIYTYIYIYLHNDNSYLYRYIFYFLFNVYE